jgi:hypothetical protein
MSRPKTFGKLKESGYRPRSVKDEIRANLITRLRSGDRLFPGIVGYEHTVEPQIVNALLSRHDFILLGLRGQAKTRLLRRRCSRPAATTRRSYGSTANSATRRSSPHPTSPSPTSSGTSIRSRRRPCGSTTPTSA